MTDFTEIRPNCYWANSEAARKWLYAVDEQSFKVRSGNLFLTEPGYDSAVRETIQRAHLTVGRPADLAGDPT